LSLVRQKETLFCGIAQEQPDTAADSRKLDDDEDRQNPAYVPRKGAFFEHDLRRGGEDDTGKADDTKQYVGNSFICFTYRFLDLTVLPYVTSWKSAV